MNILLTTVSLDSERGGGTAERTRRLALNLIEAGHSCAVIAMEGGNLTDVLEAAGVTVYVTGFTRIRYSVPHINLRKLAAFVSKADAIHVLGYWNFLTVMVARAAYRAGKPYALCGAGEFFGIKGPRRIPKIFHCFFGRAIIARSEFLIAITDLEKLQIMDQLAVNGDRVLVLPNGVNLPPPPSAFIGLPARPYILFLGRLSAIKGPDLLLQAFIEIAERHTEVDLVIAGPDFGLGTQLTAISEKSGLQNRIHFLGFLNEAERTAAYETAEFLCVPSRAEAMSLVALEAAVTGIPVLLTDQCGFDIIEEIDGGVVVEATVEGVHKGLMRMLSENTDRHEMGRNIKAYVLANYAWPKIVDQLIDRLNTARMKNPIN